VWGVFCYAFVVPHGQALLGGRSTTVLAFCNVSERFGQLIECFGGAKPACDADFGGRPTFELWSAPFMERWRKANVMAEGLHGRG
jgi:hypothetical protein